MKQDPQCTGGSCTLARW